MGIFPVKYRGMILSANGGIIEDKKNLVKTVVGKKILKNPRTNRQNRRFMNEVDDDEDLATSTVDDVEDVR